MDSKTTPCEIKTLGKLSNTNICPLSEIWNATSTVAGHASLRVRCYVIFLHLVVSPTPYVTINHRRSSHKFRKMSVSSIQFDFC